MLEKVLSWILNTFRHSKVAGIFISVDRTTRQTNLMRSRKSFFLPISHLSMIRSKNIKFSPYCCQCCLLWKNILCEWKMFGWKQFGRNVCSWIMEIHDKNMARNHCSTYLAAQWRFIAHLKICKQEFMLWSQLHIILLRVSLNYRKKFLQLYN